MSIPAATQALLDYIDKSPTPYHCVAETARQLDAAGYTRVAEDAAWDLAPGARHYLHRDGSIFAFRVGARPATEAGFRLIGAHTDSPNLRLKPRASLVRDGLWQLGVEVYGGALTYTWLDRDLRLAGRVALRGADRPSAIETRLVDLARPLLRIPSLAIHLNRDVRSEGLKLNDQQHLPPLLGLAPDGFDKDDPDATLRALVAADLDIDPARILGWDLMLADAVPCSTGGVDDAFVFAPRLDNQASCHAALAALLSGEGDDLPDATALICLYDHEEVGSTSMTGAEGPIVEWTLRRLCGEGGGETERFARAMARSWQLSADMAHAVHPNYGDRHEPLHKPSLGKGPVIKINNSQRYATSGEGAALFAALCEEADVPHQTFVTRTDLACGTTIGPLSAARLGIRTIDVGNPMLSMHAIREQCATADHPRMIAVMARFLEGQR